MVLASDPRTSQCRRVGLPHEEHSSVLIKKVLGCEGEHLILKDDSQGSKPVCNYILISNTVRVVIVWPVAIAILNGMNWNWNELHSFHCKILHRPLINELLERYLPALWVKVSSSHHVTNSLLSLSIWIYRPNWPKTNEGESLFIHIARTVLPEEHTRLQLNFETRGFTQVMTEVRETTNLIMMTISSATLSG